MSALQAPRAPWIMLAVFGAVALVLFCLTAGHDFGLIGDTRPAEEITAVTHEVRMPIIIEKYETAKQEIKDDLEKEFHKTSPVETMTPVPTQQPSDNLTETPAEPHPPLQPEVRPSAEEAGPGMLLSHAFEPMDSGFTATFRTNRPVSRSEIFFKSSPAIWVVDLPGRWTNRARRVSTFERGPIEKVIIGEHDTFLRIVFRYRDRNQPRPAQAPKISEVEDGFVVVVPDER